MSTPGDWVRGSLGRAILARWADAWSTTIEKLEINEPAPATRSGPAGGEVGAGGADGVGALGDAGTFVGWLVERDPPLS